MLGRRQNTKFKKKKNEVMPTTSDDNLEDPCRHTPGASWLVALERTCRPPSSINSSQQPIRSADERDNEEIINLFLSTYTWDRGTDRVHDMCRTHRSAGGRRADDNSHRGERGDGDCDRWWGSTDDGQCLGHCGPVGPFTLLRCKMFVAAQSGALVRPYTRCRTERTDEIEFSTRSHIAALPPAASAAGLLIAGTLTAIAQIKWKQAAELCELAGSPRPPEWPNVLSIPPEWNTGTRVTSADLATRQQFSLCVGGGIVHAPLEPLVCAVRRPPPAWNIRSSLVLEPVDLVDGCDGCCGIYANIACGPQNGPQHSNSVGSRRASGLALHCSLPSFAPPGVVPLTSSAHTRRCDDLPCYGRHLSNSNPAAPRRIALRCRGGNGEFPLASSSLPIVPPVTPARPPPPNWSVVFVRGLGWLHISRRPNRPASRVRKLLRAAHERAVRGHRARLDPTAQRLGDAQRPRLPLNMSPVAAVGTAAAAAATMAPAVVLSPLAPAFVPSAALPSATSPLPGGTGNVCLGGSGDPGDPGDLGNLVLGTEAARAGRHARPMGGRLPPWTLTCSERVARGLDDRCRCNHPLEAPLKCEEFHPNEIHAPRGACHVSKLDPRERRYRARSDLIVAQNGEAKNPGPPLNPNAPTFAPAAPAVVIAAPLDPRARGFVPKAQQQRPSCPNDCVLTPEGKVAARRYNGGATRYYYSCRNCRRSFSQIRPDKLPPGHHRNPKWCKPAAAAPPPTSEPPATPKRHRHGRRHKPREWTLRAGQTQGEVALGFHNSSGKLSDETSRKNWIDALLAKLDIVGVCELGADASVQAEMEAAQRQLRDGYKAVFGRGTRAKSGMALLVSNRLATTTVQHVYDDGTGHTLIASVNVHGRLPLLIVLSHAPASTDSDRERYFTDLLSHIPEPDPRHPDRRAVWLGDFNFEEGDGTQSNAYEKMLEAYAAVCRKLGSEADGGLLDAYRIAHSDGSDTTRGDRRIDRGLIDSRLVGGLPGLADADHIHQTDLQVVKKGGKLGKKPDHKAVRITLRFSDTERPKPAPRYDPRRISADRLKVLDATITPLLKDATCDPELTEDKMQRKVAALFDGWNKADRKAHNHERHVLISKIDGCERSGQWRDIIMPS